jgi:predicted DsbA family dithiol-disulfide isomerase
LDRESILALARSLKLDSKALGECLDKDLYKAAVQKDVDEAFQLQISGTPTFIVAKTSGIVLAGTKMVGAQTYVALKEKIDELMENAVPSQ